MATALSHICGLCSGTEEKEQCRRLKYAQQQYRVVAPLWLRDPLCWVRLLKETIYHTDELCAVHGCPSWWRDVSAWYNAGLTKDGCEVGAGMCLCPQGTVNATGGAETVAIGCSRAMHSVPLECS